MALPTMPNYWQDRNYHLEAQRSRMRQQKQVLRENLRANADFFNRNQFRSDKQSNFTSKYFYNKRLGTETK